jgi:hypothetical protein
MNNPSTQSTPDKKWGIDLTGRKMWYEPWPTDEAGKYRQPTETEIEEVYGISGEAVCETLLSFEECADKELVGMNSDIGGIGRRRFESSPSNATQKLIDMLNEHIHRPEICRHPR